MAETQRDEPPFGIFRVLYSLITWSGLVVVVAILIWVMWTFFVNTSAGTARSQRLDAVRPTLTALAGALPTTPAGEGGATVELPTTCKACHTIAGTSAAGIVGPDLTHIGTVAAERLAAADYAGGATTVEAYIRESIEEPSAYVVPDKPTYKTAAGASAMPAGLAAGMKPGELDALVEALAALR